MRTTRRSFIANIAAALAAPAIVRAESLMPLWVPKPALIIPEVIPGFLPADGRLLNVASYRMLFEALGHAYGGDGDQFRVPDLRARQVVQSRIVDGEYVISTGAGAEPGYASSIAPGTAVAGQIIQRLRFMDMGDAQN